MPTRSPLGMLTPLLSTEMKHTIYQIALRNVKHSLPTFELRLELLDAWQKGMWQKRV